MEAVSLRHPFIRSTFYAKYDNDAIMLLCALIMLFLFMQDQDDGNNAHTYLLFFLSSVFSFQNTLLTWLHQLARWNSESHR
jgi:hypothetical protein